MARIPIQIAGRGLETGQAVQYSGADPVGRALQGFGNAMQDTGDRMFALAERHRQMLERDDAFSAEQNRQQFEQRFMGQLPQLRDKAPPNGAGFHDDGLKLYDQEAANYLKTVPQNLQPKFSQLVQTQRGVLSNQLAGEQQEKRNAWFRDGITKAVESAATKAVNYPEMFTAAKQEAYASIDASDLSEAEKADIKTKTDDFLSTRLSERLRQLDPEYLRANLGVSRAGSVVSPGDPSLPAGMRNNNPGNLKYSDGVRRRYRGVLGPSQNTDQGDAQAVFETPEAGMRAMYELALGKYQGGKTTANQLIAGQGGWTPGNREAAANVARYMGVDPDADLNLTDRNGAAKFLRALMIQEHGKASAAYSNEMISAAIDGTTTGSVARGAERTARDLPITGQGGQTRDLDGVQPIVTNRFIALQNQFGRILPVSSGYRDPQHNAAVGGAKGSQHMDGNALDIDVSHLSKDERTDLIGMASAMGFTGVGVYANSLHLDMGPRRAWGPDHYGESVPDWARTAVQAHLAGVPDAASAGKPLRSQQTPLDPRLAGIPFSKRLALAGTLDREIEAKQRQAATGADEQFKLYRGQLEVRARLADLTVPELMSDPVLQRRPGDLADLLGMVQAGQGEKTRKTEALNEYQAGGLRNLNPLDDDQRNKADDAFDALVQSLPADATPEQRAMLSDQFVQDTHIIPQGVQASLREGIFTNQAPQLAEGLMRAVRIQQSAPLAFENMANGEEASRDVTTFRALVDGRGYSALEAAKEVLERRTGNYQRSKEVWQVAATKAADRLELSRVLPAFDPDGLFNKPGAGSTNQTQNVLLAQYREIYAEEFVEANGNETVAAAQTQRIMKRTWGISHISGEPQLMQYPPEKFYRTVAGGYDYLREDALKTAQEIAGPDAKIENIALIPAFDATTGRSLTAADVRMGRAPRYSIAYVHNVDGIPTFDMVPGTWAVLPETQKALDQKDRDANFARAQVERDQMSDALDRSNMSMRDLLMQEPDEPDIPAQPVPTRARNDRPTTVLPPSAGRGVYNRPQPPEPNFDDPALTNLGVFGSATVAERLKARQVQLFNEFRREP